jgi:hypothetical protein
MKVIKNFNKDFEVTSSEYELLDKKFGKLCSFATWQLLKKNVNNNHINEYDDIFQEQQIALLVAGYYQKRQTYIANSLKVAKKYAKNDFIKSLVSELSDLWDNRKRHGANRQTFGPLQEKILDKIIQHHVPRKYRPSRKAPLIIDPDFSTYCKAILWNCQKTMGKKITREKSIRAAQVSINDFDYLASC